MAELEIGYNIKKAKELMDEIAKNYKDLKNAITEQWDGVVTVLQKEWVGMDEQDYENNFAKRICTLYENAFKLAQGGCETIANLAESWYKFQATNTLEGSDGARAGANAGINIEVPNFSFENDIVKMKENSAASDENTDKGLRSSGSAAAIQSAVTDYATNVKKAADTMFDGIKADQAFFGEQVSSIETFISALGDSIAEVVVAVKDLYSRLEELANKNYTTSDSEAASGMSQSKTEVEKATDSLGESKWS